MTLLQSGIKSWGRIKKQSQDNINKALLSKAANGIDIAKRVRHKDHATITMAIERVKSKSELSSQAWEGTAHVMLELTRAGYEPRIRTKAQRGAIALLVHLETLSSVRAITVARFGCRGSIHLVPRAA